MSLSGFWCDVSVAVTGSANTSHPLLLVISLLFPSLIHLHKAEKLGPIILPLLKPLTLTRFFPAPEGHFSTALAPKAGGDIRLGNLKSGPNLERRGHWVSSVPPLTEF